MVKAFPEKLSEIGGKMEKVKLIYGTTNAGKVELMRRYLRRLKGVEIVGLGELPQTVLEPEEDGADHGADEKYGDHQAAAPGDTKGECIHGRPPVKRCVDILTFL